MIETPGPAAVQAAFAALRSDMAFPDAAARRDRLRALRAATKAAAEDLAHAVDADFGGRPRPETLLAEVALTLSAIDWTLRRIGRWMRPQRVRLPIEFWGARARIERVPLGRVGILAPWNYPVQLALVPLVAALAGGNRVLLKPSEHTPRTAAALAALVHGALPADEVRVLTGGPDVAQALVALPLEGLMFTGSTATGRQVARAAAGNLVPLVLELGGKSPALMMPDADPAATAAAVMAGKLYSGGQTCIAPDYLLLPRGQMQEMIAALRQAAMRLHGRPGHPDLAAICRPADRERLTALLQGHAAIPLLDPMPEAPRLGPWAIPDPDPDSPLMQEEIFGPLLPLVPYDSVDEAVAFANARPVPLALYVFGRDVAAAERVVARIRSGGALINETLFHVAAHPLPFGGAGESGLGAYHGEEGFRAFTRPRSVMVAGRRMPARLARPPYGRMTARLIRHLLR